MSTPTPPANPENGMIYTLEILSEITGISTQTILQYQEHGLIRQGHEDDAASFNDETVRALRRIEHLRELCEPNVTGLKLLTRLLEEVELLRAELRANR